TVTAPNVIGFVDISKFVERARFDALGQIGKLLRSRGASAPDYAPTGVALLVQKLADSNEGVPWTAMPLETFGEPFATINVRCGIVTGPDAAAVTALVQQPHVWSSGGGVYHVEARPLLPGDTTC